MSNHTPGTGHGRTCSFEGCGRAHSAHGYCQSHARQLRLGRKLTPLQIQLKGKTVSERLWAHVDKSGECWEWTAYKNEFGYGRLRIGSKLQLAHRVAFELTYGPIPDGKIVDHICHNPGCVNPAHLRAATIKQNSENRYGAQKNSLTGLRGVQVRKSRGTFVALVKHNGEPYYLGVFSTAAAAGAAAAAKRLELYTHNVQDQLNT